MAHRLLMRVLTLRRSSCEAVRTAVCMGER